MNHVQNATSSRAERRNSTRFPLEQKLSYRVLNKRGGNEAGVGVSINMSSSAIYFTAEHELTPGRNVEMDVEWPARLDDRTALKLVASGRVVRASGVNAVVGINNYEIRTRGSRGLNTFVD